MEFKRIPFLQFETLNTGFPTEIPDKHFSDTLNMIRREDGMWENRKGIKQFGADVGSGLPIHSLSFWQTSPGVRYLTVGTGTDIYSYAEGTEYNNGTFTNRKTISSDAPWDSVVYRSIIVIGNGVSNLYTSTDNSTFTERIASAGPPLIVKSKFLEVGNDFVSFGGIPNDYDKIVLSSGAPTNPWEANSSNAANIDIGNSDYVTGTKALGDVLVVTKTNRTYQVALSDFARKTLDWAGGAESNRALLQTQLNALFIAGRQGIFDIAKTQIGNNQLFGSPESQNIKNLYNLTTDYSAINGLYTKKDNYAFWNTPTTLGDLTFIRFLDFKEQVWSYFRGVNSNDWTTYIDANQNEHYLYADGATDKIWEFLTGRNDNGAPILSRLTSKRTDLGQPGLKKRIHYVEIYGYISKNAIWDVRIYQDDDTQNPLTFTINQNQLTTSQVFEGLGVHPLGTTPLGALLPTGDGDIEVFPFKARIPVDADYEKIQVELENNQVDSRVILRAIVFELDMQPEDLYENQNIL